MKKLQWIAILLALATLFIGCPPTTDSGLGSGGENPGGGTGNENEETEYTPPPLPTADVDYYVSVTGTSKGPGLSALTALDTVQAAVDKAVGDTNNGKVVHIHINGNIIKEGTVDAGSDNADDGMVEIENTTSTAHIVLRGTGKGGTINAAGKNKRAVYVNLPNGTVTFGDNLTITGGNVSGVGAGVQISNTPVVINGTTITDNGASSNGGGIYVAGNGTNLTIESGTIRNNTAGLGSGIMLASGTELTMKGGLVENNSNGYAIHLSTATMTMSGGSIMNNTGGGVNLVSRTLSLSGNVVITQNTKDGAANNVSKHSDGKIYLRGALASGSNIGITTTAAAGTTIVSAGNVSEENVYSITESDRKKIHNDKDGTLFTLAENELLNGVFYVSATREGDVLTIKEDSAGKSLKFAIVAATKESGMAFSDPEEGITSIVIEAPVNGTKIIAEKNFGNIFYGFSEVIQITGLEHLDTSRAVDMGYVFQSCSSLTSLDLRSWDVSNVGNMRSMFSGCTALSELDISGWDTTKVTTTSGIGLGGSPADGAENMFNRCEALKQNGIIKDGATISETIQAKIDAL